MKKSLLLAFCAALLCLASCSRDNDRKVIVITLDGLRWQEVFTGADEALINNPAHVRDIPATKAKFWRDTPEERREALLPFLWSYVPEHGYVLGNRKLESRVQVANPYRFSYPGYSELFCGFVDENINSNDPVGNPNVSVLEVVNQDPRYKGKVMMYASWESIRYAVNNERGGFPGSARYEPGLSDTPTTKVIDRMQEAMPRIWGGERFDAFTMAYALETLKKDRPKVFYVGLGDTDEFGHDRSYDRYLDITLETDRFIRDIVEYCESDPYYKGKTTYLISTDHGRGRGENYTGHGANLRGSEETFLFAFGAGMPALGETKHNGPYYNKQMAAMIAHLTGVDFTPGNGEKCEPYDPEWYGGDGRPDASTAPRFEAMNVSPKGQGIRYAYKEGDFMSTAEVVAAPVKARGLSSTFSTARKMREDHFGFQFEGLVKIDQDGLYLLSFSSDDGAKLWIDGQLICDVDRDGGGISDAWVNLAKGYHRIKADYFENYGDDSIEVGLEGPGIQVDNLPAEMLFHE